MRPLASALATMALAFSLCGVGTLRGESLAQTTAIETARELVLGPPAGVSSTFRFLPDGKSLAFDRPLVLSAASGEERLYSIEIRQGAAILRRDIRIDRRPPPAPEASLPSGTYEGPLSIALRGESDATINYSVAGSAANFSPFRTWDPAHPILLPASTASTATWVVIAHAVDLAGNRGEEARFVYRIKPPQFSAEAPVVEGPRAAPRPESQIEPGQPRLALEVGRSTLTFTSPIIGSLVAAVAPRSAINLAASWSPLVKAGSESILELECPYGWEGDLDVYVGIGATSIVYKPTPYRVHLANSGLASRKIVSPEAPSRLEGSGGGPSMIAFPAYSDDILFAKDDGAESVYQEPFPIEPGKGSVHISWRGRDARGNFSDRQQADFTRPPALTPFAILGAEGPERRASAFHLRVSAASPVIRYELTSDGRLPPEPGRASAILDGEIVLDAPPGRTLTYLVRYRPFSDAGGAAVGGETASLRFTVDREAPDKPWLIGSAPPYSRTPLTLGLGTKEGTIFTSLTQDPNKTSFKEYGSSLELDGSVDGPRNWYLSAYTVDEAGNRSALLGPLRYTVDTACNYLDAFALPGGDGTPENPFGTLEEALAAASNSGRGVLRIRGDFTLSKPLVIDSGNLRIEGGYGADWYERRDGLTRFKLIAPRLGRASLVVRNASLFIRGIDLASDAGDGQFCALDNATLSLDTLALVGRSRMNLVLVSSISSKLIIASSTILLEGDGGGALISSENSLVSIGGSDLGSGPGIGYFTGISLSEGSLAVSGSRLRSSANLSLVGIAARGATITVDKTSFAFTGTSGYLRCATLALSRGEIGNTRVEIDDAPASSLFELSDSPFSFVHDTVFVGSSSAGLIFFDARGGSPRLVNDLFIASDGDATLLRGDRTPDSDSIISCAFGGISTFTAGALTLTDPAKLATLNAGKAYPPFVILPASAPVLGRSPKDGISVLPGTPIIDAALPLADKVYATDFSGFPRPAAVGKSLPDIGADEFQER